MRWAERLRRLTLGDETAERREVLEGVAGLQARLVGQARQLAEHAEQSLSDAGTRQLTELAELAEARATELAALLTAHGVAARPPQRDPQPRTENHWARVVADLALQRDIQATAQGLEERARDVDQDLAEELAEFNAGFAALERRLHVLVARADPQAAD